MCCWSVVLVMVVQTHAASSGDGLVGALKTCYCWGGIAPLCSIADERFVDAGIGHISLCVTFFFTLSACLGYEFSEFLQFLLLLVTTLALALPHNLLDVVLLRS